MLDFRLEEDRKKGVGYRIFCNSCGQTSLSSHESYCPVCGRGTATPFTATKLGEEKKMYVSFRISGRYVAEVPCCETEDIRAIIRKAVSRYEDADFGELSEIDAEVLRIEDEDGNTLWEK